MQRRDYLIVFVLCLLCTSIGGVGGFHLKTKMLKSEKPLQSFDLTAKQPVPDTSDNDSNLNQFNNKTIQSASTTEALSSSKKSLNIYDGNQRDIKNLIQAIHAISQRQGIELDIVKQAKTEIEFVNLIDESPALINSLLDVYQQISIEPTRSFFRSLLITTGSRVIEQRAMDYLLSGELKFRAGWLELLRDTGVQSSQTRNNLLVMLPSLNQAEEIRDLILSIKPQVVSTDERLMLFNQLELYLLHDDEMVRSAAVETLSKWGDESHAHIIEQALADSTEQVRFAAISAAFSTPIRSDYIESNLLEIMNNTQENMRLRIHAYNALSNYSLDGSAYEQYYRFHQQLTAHQNTGGAKG